MADKNSGFFISFESIDGLGKTTQLQQLDKGLSDAGYSIFCTKEPGDAKMGSNIGAGIRKLLFNDPTTKHMRQGVADLLFLADHIQTAGDIQEFVDDGYVVLCDRYADSQFAYAASSGKNCPDWALQAYSDHFGIIPDMTILLVARGNTIGIGSQEDISWALGRAKGRIGVEAGKQDGKAWNDAEQQRHIQNAYLERLKGWERTFLVDVWEPTDIGEIHQAILVESLRRIGLKQDRYPQSELTQVI